MEGFQTQLPKQSHSIWGKTEFSLVVSGKLGGSFYDIIL